MKDFLAKIYLGNSVAQYATALGVLMGSLVALFIAERVLLRRLERWAAATTTTLDDLVVGMVRKAFIPLLTAGAFILSLQGLVLPSALRKGVVLAWTALLTVFAVRCILSVISHVLKERWNGGRPGASQAVHAVLPFIQVLAWTVGLVFFLDNAGVKISAMVAGLGIGGIAVALAAQAALGDLFSYVAILLDRPFAIGDFIVVDDLMGTVEGIGVKTTRIRSLTGEILVIPNSALTGSRIRNFQAMARRRVVFTLGLVYETPSEKLKEVPGLLRSIIEAAPDTVFDRAHFFSYGESSLDFEAVYFVQTGDYNRYMDIRQTINFAIKDEFDKRGLAFAYPTRTLYTASVPQPPQS